MTEVHPIIADASALLGLASCDAEYSDLIFSEIGITTTWTCYKEIRDNSRNARSDWVQDSAQRIMDYVQDGAIPYPNRVNLPGSPTAGEYNAGEKSIQIALSKYESISTVIIYDREAVVLLERQQRQCSGTPYEFEIEPPNFPLYLLTLRDGDQPGIDNDIFNEQTEKLLQRMNWKGSRQEDLFWKYPTES